jgi:hypothetical protein
MRSDAAFDAVSVTFILTALYVVPESVHVTVIFETGTLAMRLPQE